MKANLLKLTIIYVSLTLGLTGFSSCLSSNQRAANREAGSRSSASSSTVNSSAVSTPGQALENPASCPSGQFSKRTGFSICFDNAHKNAVWVAYELTREHLNNPVTGRTDEFVADAEFNSAKPTDFYGTIYERGHLAPSADMKWSEEAQLESFSMANMTPQTHAMNHGRWKDLEEQIRNWARKFGRVYIVMGPMLEDSLSKVPGTDVSIPKAHFKCVLAVGNQTAVTGESGTKSICFIIPQEPTQTLPAYIHTVDEVEAATKLDLFAALDDSIEERVESTAVLEDWMRGLSMKPFLNASRPQKAPQRPRVQYSAEESAQAFSCEPKTCKQMKSCAEARYQLNTCGNKRIDGDGNGVPCEALCRGN